LTELWLGPATPVAHHSTLMQLMGGKGGFEYEIPWWSYYFNLY